MKRFILLSFGFLGWAFYEMSGGSDFESASDREARLNPAPEVVVTEVAEAEAVAAAERTTPDVIDTDPPQQDVTRVALNLTTLDDAQEVQETQDNQIANIDPETGVAENADILSSADTPAIIPSLIVGNNTQPQAQTELASAPADLRQVSGNRVNVRGGPGTDFGIVSRLVRGDEVEILQDNGNGWVRMRPVGGGTEGWMADFLLTSG